MRPLRLQDKFSLLVELLARLVSNTAGCLACRLARCLALAASTCLNCVVKCLGCKCLDSFHHSILLKYHLLYSFRSGKPPPPNISF